MFRRQCQLNRSHVWIHEVNHTIHEMNNQPYLSVIVPAYNEAKNFHKGTLDSIYEYLQREPFSWELILVNDGSSDSTLSLLEQFAASRQSVRVINNPHQGKAAAITSGVTESHGEIILFTDMDQATPITEMANLLPEFSRGYDIVIGSRKGRKGAPIYRQILAYGMIILRGLILRLPIRDSQCGFKAFTASSARKIFSILAKIHPPRVLSGPAVNPGFDVEILYLGRKLGYRLAEVPVIWTHQESKRVRFAQDAISGLKELLLVRFRSLTNAYGLKS